MVSKKTNNRLLNVYPYSKPIEDHKMHLLYIVYKISNNKTSNKTYIFLGIYSTTGIYIYIKEVYIHICIPIDCYTYTPHPRNLLVFPFENWREYLMAKIREV